MQICRCRASKMLLQSPESFIAKRELCVRTFLHWRQIDSVTLGVYFYLVVVMLIPSHAQVYAQPVPDFQIDLTGSLIPNDPTAGLANQDVIQAAIDEAHGHGGGAVQIPVGTFYIEPFIQDRFLAPIILRSHVHVVMTDATTLKLLTEDVPPRPYGLFEIRQNEPSGETLQSVRLSGGHLIGPDKEVPVGTVCEPGNPQGGVVQPCEYGILIQGDVQDVQIDQVDISAFTLDGLQIQERGQDAIAPSAVVLHQVRAHHNQRSGLSVSGGSSLQIQQGQYNANFLAGINIENESGRRIHDLQIQGVEASYNLDPRLENGTQSNIGIYVHKGTCLTCGEASDLRITDFSIVGCHVEGNGENGITINGEASALSLVDPPLSDFIVRRNTIINSQRGSGLTITNSTGWKVLRNYVEGHALRGIIAQATTNFVIARNAVFNNGESGIRVGGRYIGPRICSTDDVCRIVRNVSSDNGRSGVMVTEGSLLIRQNEFYRNSIVGVNVGGPLGMNVDQTEVPSGTDGTRVIGNTITRSVFEGINVEAKQAIIQGNTVSQSSRIGIHAAPSASGVLIRQNTVEDSGGNGIHVGTGDSPVVRSNDVKRNNGDGVLLSHIDFADQVGGNSVVGSGTIGIHILSASPDIDEATIGALNSVEGSGIQDVRIEP